MTVTTAFVILKRDSERVPGKNWRLLGSQPLYRWILDTLVAVPTIQRILLDTDAPDLVAAHGLPPGPIHVVERAPALRGHAVTANTLLAAHLPPQGDAPWVMVHATSPFLRPGTLAGALDAARHAFAQGTADSLFGVTRHQARFWHPDGTPLNHDPARLVPTQDLAPIDEENSSVYVFTPSSFAAAGSRIGRRPLPYPVPRLDAVDIDTEDDWALAVALTAGLPPR